MNRGKSAAQVSYETPEPTASFPLGAAVHSGERSTNPPETMNTSSLHPVSDADIVRIVQS